MTELDLFAAAIATPDAAARAALLDRECGSNPALRARLDKLLAAHFTASPLLGPPADGGTVTHMPEEAEADAATVERPGKDEHVGAVLGGKYKLIEEIGEGGMGSVFMAQQTEPVRRAVAVKVIKAGMDSKAVLARFEAERQALAIMDHPNIAKVLDAGTTEGGRPYFVMELVKGVPITQYCDERRLTPRQRLELFVPVCNAIQHAHQKGVIHRDIKPNNVLVAMYDDRPVPKVIDFGVAKAAGPALTDKTLMTGFGAVVGTPEYMSPEQANLNNLDIDTRSDVYSLGVLLYELLTGSTPVDRKSLGKAALLEVLRIVREVEAPRPSAKLSTIDTLPSVAASRGTEPAKLSKLMKGELDWVLLKALEKDRARRYESANGLAADVQRHLSGEQVQAVPPSVGYRVRKFVRKHRGPVLAAAVVAVAVLLGFAGTTSGMVWALNAEGKAKSDRDAAVKAQEEASANEVRANAEADKLKAAKEQQAADQYLWDMQLLPSLFETASTAELMRVLNGHTPKAGEPDRRCFEWHYWNRRINSHVATAWLSGEFDPSGVRHWSTSPDGTKVARVTLPDTKTGKKESVLTVWDVTSRRELFSRPVPVVRVDQPPGASGFPTGLGVRSAQFSGDGRRVLVGSEGLLQVIDSQTGKLVAETPAADMNPSREVMLSRDGRRLLVMPPSVRDPRSARLAPAGAGYTLRILDVDTNKPAHTSVVQTGTQDLILHPDGETYLTARRVPARELPDHLAAVVGATADALEASTRIEVREVGTDKVRRWWPEPNGRVQRMAISDDGGKLSVMVTSTSRGEFSFAVKVFETDTGRELSTWSIPPYTLPTSQMSSGTIPITMWFSSNGTRLFVRNSVTPGGWVSILDVRSGLTTSSFEGVNGYNIGDRHEFSPDGKLLVACSNNLLRVWNTMSGRLLHTFRGHASPVAAFGFTPDGDRLWSVEQSGLLKEWDLRTPVPAAVPVSPTVAAALLTTGLTLSPGGDRTGLLMRDDGLSPFALAVVDSSGRPMTTLRPPPGVGRVRTNTFDTSSYSAALSAGGRRATVVRQSSDFGSELIVWDVETGKVVFSPTAKMEGGGPQSPAVVISADGKRVAMKVPDRRPGRPALSQVWVYEVDDKSEGKRLTVPAGTVEVSEVRFSPAGDRLAGVIAVQDEAKSVLTPKLVVWDVAGGDPLTQNIAQDERVAAAIQAVSTSVAWAADGSRIAVSHNRRSAESVFAVFDATTGMRTVALELALTSSVFGGNTSSRTGVTFSPDGKRVAAFESGSPQTQVKVWDAVGGKMLVSLKGRDTGTPEFVSSTLTRQLAFSADSHRLLLVETTRDVYRQSGTGIAPVYSALFTTFDASPPPEAKK